MSFLDSVLSSIGSSGGSKPLPPPSRVVPVSKPDIPATSAVKRKAEEDLRSTTDKSLKVERTSTGQPADRPIKPVQAIKQNGTTLPARIAAPMTPSPASGMATTNKNPKKGSFAAIMARAKEAQAAPASSAGTITHKPKEKTLTRKELISNREMAKKAARRGVPLSTMMKSSAAKDITKKPVTDKTSAGTSKSGTGSTTKRPTKPGYQGTMKPNTGSTFTGTARSSYSGTAAPRKPQGPVADRSMQARNRDRDQYDESEEYESDDGYDYASEDYSDMDAGFEFMEDEEEEAARIARKEDAAAQAELDRLKREKERKKALLQKGKR